MKGGRKAAAAAVAKSAVLRELGLYLGWVGASTAPLVGGLIDATGFTASGGMLNVAAGGSGGISMDAANVDLSSGSLIIAIRYKLLDPTNQPYISSCGMGFFLGASVDATAFLSFGDGASNASPGSTMLPAAGASEHAAVIVYDGITNKAALSIDNGALVFGAAQALVNSDNNRFTGFDVDNTASAYAFSIRDCQVIYFAGKGLPSGMTSLIASYNANPLAKLSKWAR